MGIKKFKCGMCKSDQRIARTRKGLRDHLKSEHRVKNEYANSKDSSGKRAKSTRQRWWIVEDF